MENTRSNIRFYIASDPAGVGILAASLFEQLIHSKPDCVLGLATGSTPLPLYRELIALEQAGKIRFSQVRTVNLDEYHGLSPEHPNSFRHFMQEHLFDHISIQAENTILPLGLTEDAAAMCSAYETQISDWGGIDLQLLGIGHNGHIGFNEPSDAFSAETHMVTLSQRTRDANKRFFRSIADVPTTAYTMGIGTIMQAKKILLIATGADKAGILHQAFCGPVTPQIPASILQRHPDVTVICDSSAAALLADELTPGNTPL